LQLHPVPVTSSPRRGMHSHGGGRRAPNVGFNQVTEVGVQKEAPMDYQEGIIPDEVGEGQKAPCGSAGGTLVGVSDPHPQFTAVSQELPVGFAVSVYGQGDITNPVLL